MRGTNLKRWAEQHNYPLTTVYLAARGDRAGIRSVEIRNQLLAYVGQN